MGRRNANPLTNPLHYASPQMLNGPPASYAAAQRSLKSYDYVIVGAGAAGCVLASKLSEDKNVSVLVLEAGGDNRKVFESKVPLMFSKLFHSPHDWDYYTVEQSQLANRSLYWPRGKILGGSSSMNAMMYHHCSPSDFDEWANTHGCQGWSHADLAPYLRSMERFTPHPGRPAIDAQHRGSTGQWMTGYSWLSEIVEKGFLPACADAQIPDVADVNTKQGGLGVTRFQTFIDTKGQRSSLATAFFTPDVLARPNLYVACNVRVNRVLFDLITTKEPTAIGVELQTTRGGPRFEVHARREVILSGGTINTPQTLLLSGIGPADELTKHGIPVVKENNAVGRNMKDHLCTTPITIKAKDGYTLDYLGNDLKALPALARWLLTGGGPLTSNVGEAAAFIRSVDYNFAQTTKSPQDKASSVNAPDLEIIGAPICFLQHGEEKPLNDSSIFTLVPIGLRPESRGTITLRSRDVFDAAIIDPRYLTDKDNNDRNVLLVGLRVCLKIMQSPAFKAYFDPVPVNDDPTSYWWPYSSSNPDAITDDQLIRFMDEKAFTLYHPVGSARMGPSPATSVVDPECRVHGVKCLRVMDASVFPEQISGHPTAPIAAMAAKLSAMIREGAAVGSPVAANL
ncbi:Glucose-methanol-choline oxidoreductase [Penicillium ucsense]|uniref:Glucose-methanol-choline oxidoreductase n=1 Tax=Penicillium ucsense TaxID=2839758 RepID=A0A8J8W331_9EURO|nr:Glucose-methanol-choline oxidoreductase [Penicillium ucsense]KAF7737003.1 Glucose-methanol-choline oxidoreductase [Penicillium ucsense]